MIYINITNNILKYNIEINNYYKDPNKPINDIECNYVKTINLATINDTNIFTSIHMNARSNVCNCDAISTFLNSLSFNFYIIVISETWLKSYNKGSYKLEDYNSVHTIRGNDMKGSGTSIYIKKWISFIKIENLSLSIDNAFDIVTVSLNIGDINKSTIISAIYKPPNTDIINCTGHIL